jgi:membrane protease YdiL (CAAX protease family)
MIIPMILPLIYTLKYRRDSFFEIILITLSMIFFVIAYWPLTIGFRSTANIISKYILLVLIPYVILKIYWIYKNEKRDHFEQLGLTNKGLESSFKLGLMLIPIMLFITFLAKLLMNNSIMEPNLEVGVVSFIESFSEEFFHRGILFLLLSDKTNIKIAYITSFTSFILMHPQNFTNPFIISTIAQGIITLEICRRTKNLIGAWVLHGTNRFFSIVIIPFFL